MYSVVFTFNSIGYLILYWSCSYQSSFYELSCIQQKQWSCIIRRCLSL